MQYQKKYTINFIKKIHLTEEITTYYFERPAKFTLMAGQYNRWTLPFSITDGNGSSRFFTISSSPLDTKYLTFTTKHGSSGFKQALHRLKPFDQVTIFGPMGTLTYQESINRPLILLSGGMGITPFYSMLLYAKEKHSAQPITLIASFAHSNDIIYYKELTSIAQKQKNISIIFTVTSKGGKQRNIHTETGRITKQFLTTYVSEMNVALFYIVGSITVETALIKLLTRSGISQENIISEQFTGY